MAMENNDNENEAESSEVTWKITMTKMKLRAE